MIELPCDTTQENYSFGVQLDGQNYTFRFLWNERASSWFFDLTRDADGTQLLSQARVTVGALALDQFVGFQDTNENQFPPGQLCVIDTTGSDTDPGRTELGNRVKMVYLDASEVVEAGVALRA